jgi:hypothetical protein
LFFSGIGEEVPQSHDSWRNDRQMGAKCLVFQFVRINTNGFFPRLTDRKQGFRKMRVWREAVSMASHSMLQKIGQELYIVWSLVVLLGVPALKSVKVGDSHKQFESFPL